MMRRMVNMAPLVVVFKKIHVSILTVTKNKGGKEA